MNQPYHEQSDLEYFPNIGEYAPDAGKKFFEYYNAATVRHCPYCIDAFTNKCLSLGIDNDEMMEAVHVGAAMVAGDTLAHSTQMRKIIKKKEM